MAVNHLEQVLTTAGLPADQVKALIDLKEDAPDFKPDTYVAPIRTTVETAIKNDAEFYKGLNKENLPKEFLRDVEKDQYGKAANQVRTNLLKNAGLTEKDFADLDEEAMKKLDVFTPAFIKKVSEGKVTDAELQKKLMEANQKIEDFTKKEPEIEEKYKAAAEQEKAAFIFDAAIINSLAKVQGLKVPPDYIAEKVAAKIREVYDYKAAGKSVELLQKGKTLQAMDGGTKLLTLDKAVADLVTKEMPEAIQAKKTITTQKGKTGVVDGDDGELPVRSSHVDEKLQKRLAEDAKLAG